MVKYLQDEPKAADPLMAQAESAGVSSGAFLYNYSLVKMALVDPQGSRRYLEQARAKDIRLVQQLQAVEEHLPDGDPHLVADMRLPIQSLLGSLFSSRSGVAERTERVLSAVMPGTGVASMVLLGVVLLILFLIVPKVRVRPRRSTLYSEYFTPRWLQALLLLAPGGGWLLTSRATTAWIIASAVCVALLPLTGWPGEATRLFSLLPWLQPVYLPAAGLLLLVVLYAGYYLVDQAEV